MEKHIHKFIGTVEGFLDGDRDKARLAVSAMVGVIALSRVITDEEEALALLDSVREQLVQFEDAQDEK